MVVTYDNIETEVQTTIYNIISNDSSITAKTTNIFSGIPKALKRGTGYPYILIHYPEARIEFWNDNNSYSSDIITTIEILSLKESNVAEIAALIRKSLIDNQATTDTANLTQLRISDSVRDTTIDANDKIVHKITFDVFYKWTGSA